MFKWIKYKCWSAASCELIFVCVCLLLTPLNPAIYLRDGPRASARDARLMCSAHGGTRHHGSLLGRYVRWRFFFFFLGNLGLLFCNTWLKVIVKYIGRKQWQDLGTCAVDWNSVNHCKFSIFWPRCLQQHPVHEGKKALRGCFLFCFFGLLQSNRGNATCFEPL